MARKRPWLALVMGLIIVFPAYGETLEPFDDYNPPPLLFDTPPLSRESESGFLTAIEHPPKSGQVPLPPKKPQPPARAEKWAKKSPHNPQIPRPASPKSVEWRVSPIPGKKSSSELVEGQSLVNPSTQDVLASIEGIKPVENIRGEKVSLPFVVGETSLTLNMKNILLEKSLPAIKKAIKSSIEIRTYATPGKSGNVNTALQLSLARALEIRDFLTAAGVNPARINIMPFGNQAAVPPSDRVDVIIVKGRKP